MADGAANDKAKNAAMAAYMKKHPGSYPDSVMRPWGGCGADDRARAMNMGRVPSSGSTFDRGMLGGMLAERLGFSAVVISDAA